MFKFNEKNEVCEDKIWFIVVFLKINEWSEKLNVNYFKEDEIKEFFEGFKYV